METEIKRQLTLPNDVKQVPLLAEFIDGICEAAEVDMMLTMQLNLAIEEAVVNVMNYAYPAGTEGTVCIDAQMSNGVLQFVISDSGAPFDPTARAEVDTTLSAEERGIGGLGIHIVRQIMDSIDYKRVDGRNVLTLGKKL
ncbi:ATP-binding protein [uncultured Prevotella sp.]|jgi:sigma-B regulation protein RsbU (phosphoserine phosphatase)|uniref:ATP-binding protein n=1 Tax=uncultured Prevotella sp. TaxID=159272 RepID=UPI0025FEB7B2|nr:ATP-binding protein [uncultured Prevotella sp.]